MAPKVFSENSWRPEGPDIACMYRGRARVEPLPWVSTIRTRRKSPGRLPGSGRVGRAMPFWKGPVAPLLAGRAPHLPWAGSVLRRDLNKCWDSWTEKAALPGRDPRGAKNFGSLSAGLCSTCFVGVERPPFYGLSGTIFAVTSAFSLCVGPAWDPTGLCGAVFARRWQRLAGRQVRLAASCFRAIDQGGDASAMGMMRRDSAQGQKTLVPFRSSRTFPLT